MKVRDIMVNSPVFCHPDSNLAAATEKMWVHNCGMLPVVDDELGVVGVITDRDICISLGTRNKRASDVLVREVMSGKLYACAPEDDIHSALETMEKHQVRRLPVVNLDGKLAGILSIGDLTLHAEKKEGKKIPDLSSDDVVGAYQGIRVRQLTEQVAQL
jgi:CBS domain-containing protein